MNRDPIGYGGGMNMYAYCDGDPVNGVDPDGTAPPFDTSSPGMNAIQNQFNAWGAKYNDWSQKHVKPVGDALVKFYSTVNYY